MTPGEADNSDTGNGDTEWLYGMHTVYTVLKTTPERALRLAIQPGRRARLDKILALAAQQRVPVETVSAETLAQYASGNTQGVCLLCRSGAHRDESWLYQRLENWQDARPPLLLILDGVTDPHNLGACLRTADATGVCAVVIPKDNSVGLTPVVQKVASGAAATVPLIAVTNLARCMKKLQQLGVWISGTGQDATESLYDARFDGAVALALGAEGSGLRRLTREHCDRLLAVPMCGVVDSLNVSVTAGVCLYEIVRQRRERERA